jgi:hypothetical protein
MSRIILGYDLVNTGKIETTGKVFFWDFFSVGVVLKYQDEV